MEMEKTLVVPWELVVEVEMDEGILVKLSWGSGGGCLGGEEEELEEVKAFSFVKRREKRK